MLDRKGPYYENNRGKPQERSADKQYHADKQHCANPHQTALLLETTRIKNRRGTDHGDNCEDTIGVVQKGE